MGLIQPPWFVLVRDNLRIARWATPAMTHLLRHYSQILEGFSASVAIAMCTYPMRWFDSTSVFFQHMNERAPTKALRLIALLLYVPCFKLGHLFFERVYLLQQRQLTSIACHCARLRGYDIPMHFPERIPKFHKVADLSLPKSPFALD
jgi:hypothetical protein